MPAASSASRCSSTVWVPSACFGQEIVSGAEHRYQQQVEVGEHRGSSWESAVTERTADFDPLCYVSFPATTPHAGVALLI
jgi:hypothetical protein